MMPSDDFLVMCGVLPLETGYVWEDILNSCEDGCEVTSIMASEGNFTLVSLCGCKALHCAPKGRRQISQVLLGSILFSTDHEFYMVDGLGQLFRQHQAGSTPGGVFNVRTVVDHSFGGWGLNPTMKDFEENRSAKKDDMSED
jgi:hypothetical protein